MASDCDAVKRQMTPALFSQALAAGLDSAGIVDEAIEVCVGERWTEPGGTDSRLEALLAARRRLTLQKNEPFDMCEALNERESSPGFAGVAVEV